MILYDFLRLDEPDRIEAAFDAWLDSDDCGRWDLSDFGNSDACEENRFEFEGWFIEWVCGLPDPDDMTITPGGWKLLDEQSSYFFETCYDSLLPR